MPSPPASYAQGASDVGSGLIGSVAGRRTAVQSWQADRQASKHRQPWTPQKHQGRHGHHKHCYVDAKCNDTMDTTENHGQCFCALQEERRWGCRHPQPPTASTVASAVQQRERCQRHPWRIRRPRRHRHSSSSNMHRHRASCLCSSRSIRSRSRCSISSSKPRRHRVVRCQWCPCRLRRHRHHWRPFHRHRKSRQIRNRRRLLVTAFAGRV